MGNQPGRMPLTVYAIPIPIRPDLSVVGPGPARSLGRSSQPLTRPITEGGCVLSVTGVYMPYAYHKIKQEELTPQQLRVLSRLVREKFG